MTSLEAKITIARSPFPRPKRRAISTPSAWPCGACCADIAAADLVDRRRHGHVLVHHLDAGLGGLLGEWKDRGLAGMAHHRDAVRMRGDRLAQLLRHLLVLPTREDVIDLRAGVGGGLAGAVVDDSAEGVALGPADKEAQMHFAAPFVA
jgi:hypothetical protein